MKEMTAIRAWRQRMGFTQREAAAALGVALVTFQTWEHEKSRHTDKPLEPPTTALLAAAAVEAGLGPVRRPQ